MVVTIVSLLPVGYVTAGNLQGASSFGHASFVVGYFLDLFLCNYGCLIASGVGMVGHFLTLW